MDALRSAFHIPMTVFEIDRAGHVPPAEPQAQPAVPRPPARFESLSLGGPARTTCEQFDHGQLLAAVCELGFEGVVAKNHSSLYRPNDRGWVKVKNPNYWRRDAEIEAMRHSRERRAKSVSRSPLRSSAR